MKTRIRSIRNQSYELCIDNGSNKKDDRQVLAGMTLFEGTGLWMLTDIRLHQYRSPSPYSGGLFSDDIHCCFYPKSAEESQYVQSLLREFTIDEKGVINWSSFEGLVRGKPGDTGWGNHNNVGYFSRAEGLAELKRIQEFWDTYEGDPEDAKIDNPHRQLSETAVFTKAMLRRQGLHDLAATAYGPGGTPT